jgi:peptidyl-prolyl cis-trans isomerase D
LSQVVLTSEAAARAFQQKLTAGTPFAQAAQQAGFAPGDIAVGVKSRDEFAKMSGPAVADAAFRAAKGAIVGPVRSGLGWHIVKVDEVKTIAATPLASVRAELAKQIETQKGQKALADLAAAIDAKVGEGASFEQVVRERHLAVAETPPVTATGAAPDNPAWKAAPELVPLLKGAFQLGANEPPQVAPIVPNQRYALVSVAQVVAAAPPPLAKIQAQVKADLIDRRAADRARAVAQSIVSKINAGIAPADAFRQAGVALPPVQPLSAVRRDVARQGQQVPVPLQMLFTLPRGKARMAPAPDNRGWVVVYLDKIVPGDASKEAGLAEAVRSQFTPVVGDEYVQQLLGAIRGTVKVRRNEAALAKLKGELMGNGAPR